MSESQQKVFNILSKVVMWVSLAGAVASSLATYLADAGLEVPAILSSILSIIVLISRFVLRTYPGFREIFLVFGLAGSSIAATGVLTPVDEPLLIEAPALPSDDVLGDVIESDEFGALDGLKMAMSFITPLGCAHVQPIVTSVVSVLGKCLAKVGLSSLEHLINHWPGPDGGEAIDASVIGWDRLDEFISCAVSQGAFVLATSPYQAFDLPDSVGASMPPSNRILSALIDDPLFMCRGTDGEPTCIIVSP